MAAGAGSPCCVLALVIPDEVLSRSLNQGSASGVIEMTGYRIAVGNGGCTSKEPPLLPLLAAACLPALSAHVAEMGATTASWAKGVSIARKIVSGKGGTH